MENVQPSPTATAQSQTAPLPPIPPGDHQIPEHSILTQLTPERRLDVVLKEMDLLQARFDKYDDLIFRTRGWAIAGVGALLGTAITASKPEVAWLALGVAAFFFVNEVTWRWKYWYKYVKRYRFIRDVLNRCEPIEKISLYDLTHRYNRVEGPRWEKWRLGFSECVVRFEHVSVYLAMAVASLIVVRVSS
jgi:hypothetical protein